ncbi:MAG: chemotaxis sensory transducer [Acidimicrobiia bacterium]|nr:chemotaxis sensory transducer [Acidimicrobiia bacterium]
MRHCDTQYLIGLTRSETNGSSGSLLGPDTDKCPVKLTVARRLAALALVPVVAISAVALVGLQGASRQQTAGALLTKTTSLIRAELEADQAHDAIRADVFASLIAVSAQEHVQNQTDFSGHRTIINDSIGRVAELSTTAEVTAAVKDVKPDVEAYVTSANSLITQGLTNVELARAQLPTFMQRFSALETRLAHVSDVIEHSGQDAEAHAKASAASAKRVAIIIWALGGLLLLLLAWFVARSIMLPLGLLRTRIGEVADGDGNLDLTVRLDANRRDELGDVAVAFNEFVGNLSGIIQGIATNAEALASSAESLSAISAQLATAAEETAAQASAASVSAGQVSGSIASVAAGSEQMGATIAQIAANASSASAVAVEASRSASATTAIVAELVETTSSIGGVVSAISAIAQQTKLLALNATIEAARAGEAGRSFAVVASEVKELAQETENATIDITARIASIQLVTANAGVAISSKASVVKHNNDSQSTIASAVEEQTATTNDMTLSVHDVATGSVEIAANVAYVASSAAETTAGAASIEAAAAGLARLAVDLRGVVERFRY